MPRPAALSVSDDSRARRFHARVGDCGPPPSSSGVLVVTSVVYCRFSPGAAFVLDW